MIEFYTWTTPNGTKVSVTLEEMDDAIAAGAIERALPPKRR